MRRAIAVFLAIFFLSSIVPLYPEEIIPIAEESSVVVQNKMIDENEMTLGQSQALKSLAMGRNADSNWSATGGSIQQDEIYEMVFDSNGDIIVCGSIYQVSQFGSINVETEGEGDILIAKLTKDGVWDWAVSAGTAIYYDECRGVAVDSNDNVYATGYIRGDVTFGNTSQLYTTGFDGYIARVNASTGEFDMAMRFGGFDVDVGWDLAVDKYDNLYVTGFYQNITEFDAVQLNAGDESEDAKFFIAYYNTSSSFWDWARTSTGTGDAIPYQIVVDNVTNHAYVAGYNTGTETWANNTFLSSPLSTYAGFLLKYSDNGTFEWGKTISGNGCFGSNCGVYFNNVVIDPTGGVIVGGNFYSSYKKSSNTAINSQGSWDVLVAKYDHNGNRQWTYHAGGLEDDRLQALSVNQKGQVQFGGRHGFDMIFDTFTMVENNTAALKYDGFIAQIDNNSDFQWAFSIGGADNDTVGALLTLDDGSIIAGGDFSGTAWFGDMPRIANDQDIFVWKFQHDKDGDGITDYVDNCLNTANVNQSNFDSDLKGDACDNDDDNDGLHDVLDDCQYGVLEWNQTNVSLDYDADGCKDFEEDTDDDNDGVLDLVDNCQAGVMDWTPDNLTDLDGDGCRDEDEDLDDDGDTIIDLDDNCQYLVNPLQEDYDSDQIGDLCDSDDDSDGVGDFVDDCPMGELNWTSSSQTDKDGDGCKDETDEDDDDDNDGIIDDLDSCPRGEIGWNSTQSTDWDYDGCRNDLEDNDNDNDGVTNGADQCVNGITNWTRNTTNDNDADGCLDDREDSDDDNDGFNDLIDFCPTQEGSATTGMKGCPDFDGDGVADAEDAFFQDETQWNDGDGDGFGDNPSGTNPDDCPLFNGNSSKDRVGCIDTDGDGYSNPQPTWTVEMGADAFVDNPNQWSDIDGDGFGDNFEDAMFDFCAEEEGTSTVDRYGCPDTDGDGYSNPDPYWSVSKWDSLGYGPDMFIFDATQWFDTDEDGFGDNWGDPEWNDSRDPSWPGIFVEGATYGDMCPLEVPDGRFDDDVNYPGCLLESPSDGGNKKSADDDMKSSDDGMSTVTLVGIVGGAVVLALVVVIAVLMKKEPKKPDRGKKGPKSLTDIPPPQNIPGLSNNLENKSEEPESDESHADDNSNSEPETVPSWEDLPGGDYLDQDENGTNWFRANDGSNWYQNSDESWTKWQD